MQGLIFAERVGVREATELLYRNEFDDGCVAFDLGVEAYIEHYNQRLKKLITVEATKNDLPERAVHN